MKDFDNLARLYIEKRLIDVRHHFNVGLPFVVISAKNDERDRAKGKVLLVVDVRVSGQHHLEAFSFSRGQQFSVSKPLPALLTYASYFMAWEVAGKPPVEIMVEEYFHRRQEKL